MSGGYADCGDCVIDCGSRAAGNGLPAARFPHSISAACVAVALTLCCVTTAGDERTQPDAGGTWPPPWFGMIEGSETDLSERIDDILRAELGRHIS